MGFDDGLGQVEPQPGALGLADGPVGPVKAVKHVGDVGRVDAGTLVADADDDLFRADLPADADLSAGGILDGVREKVGKDLVDAGFIRQEDGKFFRKIDHDGMAVRLSPEPLRQVFDNGGDGYIRQVRLQPAGLQTGGIQKILDHGGQVIRFLLDDRQAVPDDGLIPPGILPAEGADIALDQGNRRLKLVGDDRDEGILDLLGVAEFGNIPDRGD